MGGVGRSGKGRAGRRAREPRKRPRRAGSSAVLAVLLLGAGPAWADQPVLLAQATPQNPQAAAPPSPLPPQAPGGSVATAPGLPVGLNDTVPVQPGEYSYDPSGRRDPFASIIREGQAGMGAENVDLPPLQRIGLTELQLIGIVWGAFGYSAMVQTPDGKGYTVRVGTRIGPNNGVVSAITDTSVTVEERFTDVYGKKQLREYVKHLHEKESSQ